MSYCVNCGIELAESEKNCPLCGVPIVNPAEHDRVTVSNYPTQMDKPRRIKAKQWLVVLLVALLLLIPVGICLFNDYELNGSFSWSLIVSGAEVVLFTCVFSPLMFKRFRPLLCTVIDGIASIGFLYLVQYVTGGGWFLPVGLPLSAVALLVACLLVLLVRRKKRIGSLVKAGSLLITAGLYTLLAEWVLSLHFANLTFPHWSIYTSVPCVIIGLICFVVNALPEVKDQLKRRFFI